MIQQESWFAVAKDKIFSKITEFIKKHKGILFFTALLLLVLLFLFRATWQPFFLTLREHSVVFIVLAGYFVLLAILKKIKISLKILVPLSLLIFVGLTVYLLSGAPKYLAAYFRYQSLDIVELKELPLTRLERVQPLDSIFVQASEKINETESVSLPDLILSDGRQKWSMEIAPTYLGQKLIKGTIEELFVISATSASPDFSERKKVHFSTGEHLLFSKNVKSNAIKSLTPWNYFNCFPTNVKVVPDDKGGWLQLVSLAKYKGLFFPHIEFAGVHIIQQTKPDSSPFLTFLQRVTLGLGEFIPVSEITKHAYLKGQNLIPYPASRNIAESFKFQKGFFKPIRSYHEGDIRIPQMQGNHNEMPYVLLFKGVDKKDGLFHYFGLEPYDERKHGLSLSLFIPSDGRDKKIYIYDHSSKKESLTGASAIATKVMESKKNYDWSKNQPVENRPYIKDISGKRRLFWLTTVATVNKEGGLAGSIPEIVITDAATNLPIWVDSKNQGQWLEVIQEQMQFVEQE
ncbi:MAG: hypothetical protein D3924_10585 [Candidatus Electrothrix sp. AR4]|nr:hypothetical protein [Candidatus Electrothrix sp. AR4]